MTTTARIAQASGPSTSDVGSAWSTRAAVVGRPGLVDVVGVGASRRGRSQPLGERLGRGRRAPRPWRGSRPGRRRRSRAGRSLIGAAGRSTWWAASRARSRIRPSSTSVSMSRTSHSSSIQSWRFTAPGRSSTRRAGKPRRAAGSGLDNGPVTPGAGRPGRPRCRRRAPRRRRRAPRRGRAARAAGAATARAPPPRRCGRRRSRAASEHRRPGWRRPSASDEHRAVVAAGGRAARAGPTVRGGDARHVDGQHHDQAGGRCEDASQPGQQPGRRAAARRVLAGEASPGARSGPGRRPRRPRRRRRPRRAPAPAAVRPSQLDRALSAPSIRAAVAAARARPRPSAGRRPAHARSAPIGAVDVAGWEV